MRWSIDAGDAYSVASVRHAVIEQLQVITGDEPDLYPLEAVLGELLGAEMERGHIALAIIIEHGYGGPMVHVYTQGRSAVGSTRGELRQAILQGTRLPMSIEVSPQGTHYCLRLPVAQEQDGDGDVREGTRSGR